jgi:glutathione S-transferase
MEEEEKELEIRQNREIPTEIKTLFDAAEAVLSTKSFMNGDGPTIKDVETYDSLKPHQ